MRSAAGASAGRFRRVVAASVVVVLATTSAACTRDDDHTGSGAGAPAGGATIRRAGDASTFAAVAGELFGRALGVVVTEAGGPTPRAGVPVTFVAPSDGARAAFDGRGAVVVITDVDGTAWSPRPRAGTVAGAYPVTASLAGGPSVTFALSNVDPTVVAAGDIACPPGAPVTATACQQQATADLAAGLHPDVVLPLGDEQYERGTPAEFAAYDASWGRMNDIAHPVPGNHEYGYGETSVDPDPATGYFRYFGVRSHPLQPNCRSACASWYSYDVGAWHLVALDSQCVVIGGCDPGSAEYSWLLDDLGAHPNRCTLAYWHIPLFSSSVDHEPAMEAIWDLLQRKDVDVVLNGHAHFYERFTPQDGDGRADPTHGVTQFTVGTGGRSYVAVSTSPAAHSAVRIANTFGVLAMTLSSDSWSWRFLPAAPDAEAMDAGTARCH